MALGDCQKNFAFKINFFEKPLTNLEIQSII